MVARTADRVSLVQFLADGPDVLADVRNELDVYLTEVGRDDPWAYAIYHCRTSANVYSKVRWSYHVPRSEDPPVS